MTNSVRVSDSAVRVGWWLLGIVVPLAVIFFVAVANDWIALPLSEAPKRTRTDGPFPYLVVGAVVLLVALVDTLLILWIVRRRRAGAVR